MVPSMAHLARLERLVLSISAPQYFVYAVIVPRKKGDKRCKKARFLTFGQGSSLDEAIAYAKVRVGEMRVPVSYVFSHYIGTYIDPKKMPRAFMMHDTFDGFGESYRATLDRSLSDVLAGFLD